MYRLMLAIGVLTCVAAGQTPAQADYPDAPSAQMTMVPGIAVSASQQEISDVSKRTSLPSTSSDRKTHRFFDKTNLLLTAAEVSALLADGVLTRERLGQRRLEARYDASGNMTLVSVPLYYEANPLARPFVNAGWPGQIAGGVLVVGADVGLRVLATPYEPPQS